MNNDKAEETNNQYQDPQISVKVDNEVIQLPLSKFNEILDREITKYILKNEAADEYIIDPKELINVEVWEKRYEQLNTEIKVYRSIVKQFEKDLNVDKFAQPKRCTYSSISQNVNIYNNLERHMDIVQRNSIKDHKILTISSDSEDQSIIIPDTSITKPTTLTKIDDTTLSNSKSDNNSKKLNVKCKPCPKSKKNIKVKVNGTNKVMPLNTESDQKNLATVKCLSKTKCKRKPGPKSKTKNLSNCNSSKKEVTKNPNICFKSSSKYPPPYPSVPPHNTQPLWKNVPPIPKMSIKVSGNKVTLTWNLNLSLLIAEIKMYELFVCQETDANPDVSMWKKKGNIKAERLPMACELEISELGYVYYFALRAVDVHDRRAPFALQEIKI